ncbi:ABC transporter ATP-binding protein [Oceanobacillus saliphilus]|uniref:ABC transporter ATP-binding protein n=1 Tax=Oceanobacillus saliphilus TaxID=2925834 RepID=UPI00201D80E0|nr:ABC transporter ATP-binding protein [Oceanobacillus saliphilus]
MVDKHTVLELKGITKRFSDFVANESINFQLEKGEIHALLGENGAGKSTMMNIVFGLYQPDEGEIYINNDRVTIDNPNVAIEHGIGMVHQHFKLVEPFTVTENIILGMEPKKGMSINYKQASKDIKALSDRYGLDIDPYAKVADISVGMQQRVEIVKTLYRGADILIFDEPTAVLTPQEIDELLNIMKKLVAECKSIILITHKLKEIMKIADRCTIIRRGKVIDTVKISETNTQELAEKMVGEAVSFKTEKTPSQPKDILLSVKNLVVKDANNKNMVDDISFSVRSGEVVGVAGVDGNGQSELIEAITGMRPKESGEILLKDQHIESLDTRSIYNAGISHIPGDRHKHGLVLDFSVKENMILHNYYKDEIVKNGFINEETVEKISLRLIEQYDIRTPGPQALVRSMSGGNQQKVIIAREIDMNPRVLIASQPTRGLDVGAVEFVHKEIIHQRDQGMGILLVSFELDEILNLSDRIIVLFDGQIIGETTPDKTSDRELGLMMAGNYIRGESSENQKNIPI